MTIKELLDGGRLEDWRFWFDARQRAGIALCQHYAAEYSQAGWPGHNANIIVARLAIILDEAFALLEQQKAEIDQLKETKNA